MVGRVVESVDVWRDYAGRERYGVSLCDSEGEIRCVGGWDNLGDAWEDACEEAERHGVPAYEVGEDGQIKDTYLPASLETAGA